MWWLLRQPSCSFVGDIRLHEAILDHPRRCVAQVVVVCVNIHTVTVRNIPLPTVMILGRSALLLAGQSTLSQAQQTRGTPKGLLVPLIGCRRPLLSVQPNQVRLGSMLKSTQACAILMERILPGSPTRTPAGGLGNLQNPSLNGRRAPLLGFVRRTPWVRLQEQR